MATLIWILGSILFSILIFVILSVIVTHGQRGEQSTKPLEVNNTEQFTDEEITQGNGIDVRSPQHRRIIMTQRKAQEIIDKRS